MRIAITGTPGTGKSEVAVALGKLLQAQVIHLNELAKEKHLYCGYDRKRKCDIVDIGKLEKEVENRIKGKNKTSIIESHFSHDLPADIIIILRCEIGELRRRLEKRSWPKGKIDENVEAEIMCVCREEAADTGKLLLEISTEGKAAETVAQEIKKKIRKQ